MKSITLYYFSKNTKKEFLKILSANHISVTSFCRKLQLRKNLFFCVLDGDVPINSDDLLNWFTSIYPVYFQALCLYFKFCCFL